MRSRLLALALLVGTSSAGCRKSKPPEPRPEESALPPVEVTKEGKHLYTYAEPSGAFATVDDLAAIPRQARRLVRVTDPSRAATDRRDHTNVYVVDADEVARKGKVTARVMPRRAFESGAMAQLPPGESSPLPPPAEAREVGGPETDGGPPPATSDADAVVILYGTAWCGACRAARRYLDEKKIPFVDKDIERDTRAARELAEKGERMGVPTDRVPVLEVRGRLLVGFDKARLEAMLGEPI